MTSRISFFKLTINEWKKLGWLTALQALLFALIVPLRLLLALAMEKNAGRMPLTDVLYENVGFEKLLTTATIVAMGILCALAVFSYLHSRKRLDFYYSLGLRRGTLFLVKFTAGTLTFVVPFLASQALAVLVGALYGVMSAMVVQEMTSASLLGILFFLTSYSAAALAVLLTGKTLTSVLAIGTLSGYLPMVWLVVCGCQEMFLPTLCPDGVTFLGEAYRIYRTSRRMMLDHSSPWIMILSWQANGESVRQGLTGMWPDLGSICLFLVLPAILTALCLVLCRVRKTEAAGRALAFGWTEGLIKILLAVPAALFAGMVVYEEFHSVAWEICFVAAFGALACVIMEFIYRWDIRQALAHKWHIAVTLALSLAVFLFFRFDLCGINTYLPEKEELAAMSVRYTYGGFNYYDEAGEKIRNEQDILRMLETDRVDLLYPLAEDGVENVRKTELNGSYLYLNMEYRLKSGRTFYRSYTVRRDLYEKAQQELMKDKEYRERYYPILGWDDAQLEKVDNIWVDLSQEQWEKFTQEKAGTQTGKQMEEPEEEQDVDDEKMSDGLSIEIETSIETSADDPDVGEWEYSDSGVMTGMTLTEEASRSLIRAYQEDLAESSNLYLAEGNILFADDETVGTMTISWKSEPKGEWTYYNYDRYMIREDFTRTMEVLQKAYEEDGAGDMRG